MENKSYLVIARKYRPQNFEEVIGQDPVAKTLKNAIELNRVGHAYLFTGPRGVGKTSMARILAKALDCKKGPTANPCGECTACVEIENGRYLDVLEIDGASNRGIDEIRALRENVKFAPAQGKSKIYIIDEVHQITPDGFNALLKTLEEPPAHVKFIFATTEAHKVPATILSRCQRFDFRRISAQTIADCLKSICKKEKIKIDDEALFAIAKAADGSLRDSQSILDQIASSSQKEITRLDVVRLLGQLEEDKIFEIAEAIGKKDAKQAVLLLDKVLSEGKDAALFLEKLLEHVRDLLFVKESSELAASLDISESARKALLAQKELFSKDELFYFFSVVSSTFQSMKRYESKRLPLEVALIKLANRAPMKDLESLVEELKNLKKNAGQIAAPTLPRPVMPSSAPPQSAPMSAASGSKSEQGKITLSPRKKTKEEDADTDPGDVEAQVEDISVEEIRFAPPALESNRSLDSIWLALLRNVKAEKISMGTYLEEGQPLGLFGSTAKISFPEELSFHRETLETVDNRKLIEKHISALVGHPVLLEFESVKELGQKNYTDDVAPDAAVSEAPAAPSTQVQEAMKSAMNIFGGKVTQAPGTA